MSTEKARLVGFELYFDRLQEAKEFYRDVIGLELAEDDPAHHAKFDSDGKFLCLERKGMESYPSADKAVVFVEVSDLRATAETLGSRILQRGGAGQAPKWAVVRDPEGHSVVLMQTGGE
jgi:predicted enzyme related to lactoylglutathione lyase